MQNMSQLLPMVYIHIVNLSMLSSLRVLKRLLMNCVKFQTESFMKSPLVLSMHLTFPCMKSPEIHYQLIFLLFFLQRNNSPNDAYLLNELFQRNPELLFLDSKWLLKAIQIHPYLTTTLQNFKNGEEFILPLKKEEPQPTKFNWPVLVFVFIWITMGIHITVSQTYKPLIFRYFTGHRFFVDDVMRYRERSYLNGVFLFFQHSFFTGLVVYIISALLISNTGLDILFSYIPQFAIFGKKLFLTFCFRNFIYCINSAYCIGLVILSKCIYDSF